MVSTFKKANQMARSYLGKGSNKKGSMKIFETLTDYVTEIAVLALTLVLVIVLIVEFQSSDVIVADSIADNATDDILSTLAEIPDWVSIALVFGVGILFLVAIRAIRKE